MRLIKIEACGFKSFADHIDINFNQGVTGVVGPNGCGKSNIIDAIRWVLGEQSAKKLRGASMEDVIFSGTKNRKKTNFAEVVLLFDNRDKTFELEYNQVSISRRLYRGEGNNEYYINKKIVRLKDVDNLVAGTGLGKGTLAMISQGTVREFAEAKPEDRRHIFEEAAGVSKYKKRKLESLRKLERSKWNLSRINDLVFELNQQLKTLKKQAAKAKIYLDAKNKLKDIEVSLMAIDIQELANAIKKTTEDLAISCYEKEILESKINLEEIKAINTKERIHKLDLIINQSHQDLFLVTVSMQKLETEKIKLDQKRESVVNSNYSNTGEKIVTLKLIIKNINQELSDREIWINEFNQQIIKNDKQQAIINKQLYQIENEVYYHQESLVKIKTTILFLEDKLQNKSFLHKGVKTILSSRNVLPGIVGIINDNITYDAKYENIFNILLRRYGQNIICHRKEDAKIAVKFLMNNRGGRATFLPLNNINPKTIREEALIAANTIDGFMGNVASIANFDSTVTNAINFVFGNILVAKNLASALILSQVTFKRYKVISLTGEEINVGGSFTGGTKIVNYNQNNTIKMIKKNNQNLTIIKNKINELKAKLLELNQNKETMIKNSSLILIQKAKLEEIIVIKKSKLNLTVTELEVLTGQKYELSRQINNDSLLTKLHKLINEKEKLSSLIQNNNTSKLTLLNQWKKLDDNITINKKELVIINKKHHQLEITNTKNEVKIDNFLQNLNTEYGMTFEFSKTIADFKIDLISSREIVKELRATINELGFVNVEAIAQYTKINNRYIILKNQKDELEAARKVILNIIDDMDKQIINKFDKTFQIINQEFQNSFAFLFGGGEARLEYTMPNNILESGIEVKVQPPGKAIANIKLFSGGEKSLIALSVLFAILKARPIPLCVLDEVEAPLDQANVERFANYLHQFADNTQFIIITHRIGTMERCDQLYGITMEEQGITKLVSVKLQKATNLLKN